MPRSRRVVVAGVPHHVVQRGNRRQQAFLRPEDYARYRDLMAASCARHGTEIWAYCLMPNHVHLIAVPEGEADLARAIGEAHRKYTGEVNRREGWVGHLWQGRFASYPMDEAYLIACARYIERNPVRVGLARRPQDYQWSSAAAHLGGRDDRLLRARPLLQRVPDWAALLESDDAPREDELRRAFRSGSRPLGDEPFLLRLERTHDGPIRPGRPGRPPADPCRVGAG
jgi:putative transposase